MEDDAGRVYGSPQEREPTLEVPRQLVAGEETEAAGEGVRGEEEERHARLLHRQVDGVLVVHHLPPNVPVGLPHHGFGGGRRHEVHEARADLAAVPLNEQVNTAHTVHVGERILQ